MKQSTYTFYFIIFLSIQIFAQTTPPTDDIQFWNETTVTIQLAKKNEKEVSLFFNGILRIGRNVSRPVDERIGFGFDFKINKYIKITPSYLYAAAQPYQGRREFESRLRFAVNLEKNFNFAQTPEEIKSGEEKRKKFVINNRNLVEYRFRNSRSNSTRYRNRFRFDYPLYKESTKDINGEKKKVKKELFTLYAADEVYYDFEAKDWTRNELSIGIKRKINKNLTAEFFYLLRNNKGTVLKYVNVFGVNLKFDKIKF